MCDVMPTIPEDAQPQVTPSSKPLQIEYPIAFVDLIFPFRVAVTPNWLVRREM